MNTKLTVGRAMLAEARQGEFDCAYGMLVKVLGNIVASPDEPKFRRLRVSNAKIASMLAVKGVRALLIGAGFAEESDALLLADGVPADGAALALELLTALAEERAGAEAAEKAAGIAARKEQGEKENEERKRMRLGIQDDAAARKEPGWTAKAAGVKGGKAITGCSDIGVGNDSGG